MNLKSRYPIVSFVNVSPLKQLISLFVGLATPCLWDILVPDIYNLAVTSRVPFHIHLIYQSVVSSESKLAHHNHNDKVPTEI